MVRRSFNYLSIVNKIDIRGDSHVYNRLQYILCFMPLRLLIGVSCSAFVPAQDSSAGLYPTLRWEGEVKHLIKLYIIIIIIAWDMQSMVRRSSIPNAAMVQNNNNNKIIIILILMYHCAYSTTCTTVRTHKEQKIIITLCVYYQVYNSAHTYLLKSVIRSFVCTRKQNRINETNAHT